MSYKIKLDIFEGPLDLLLHLIKKNEVDIYDIPISLITEQYLEYIEIMKEMNLDVAGEFLVVAATLVHIKSKLLLPVDEEAGEDDEEGTDPREELVRRLLEYRRFKEAAKELGDRMILGRDVFKRGHEMPLESLGEETGLMNISVFELLEALKDVLAKAPKDKKIELTVERFKIADKINFVLEKLNAESSAPFTALFPPGAVRGEIIVTFLAILELAKLQMIKLNQTDDGVIRVYVSGAQTASVKEHEITSAKEGALEEPDGQREP